MNHYIATIKANYKKFLLSRIMIILVDLLIVRGISSFIEEETGYSFLFPAIVLQFLIILQVAILAFFYLKEMFIFESDSPEGKSRYFIKQRQIYIFQICRLLIQFILLCACGIQKESCYLLFLTHGIGFILVNLLYTETWIRMIAGDRKWLIRTCLNYAFLGMVILTFYSPGKEMIGGMGIILMMRLLYNKYILTKEIGAGG